MIPFLLALPSELRDKIPSLIVSPFILAPQDFSNESDRAGLNDIQYTAAASSTLVNHQLHTETLDAMRILPIKHSYILDVAILKEEKL